MAGYDSGPNLIAGYVQVVYQWPVCSLYVYSYSTGTPVTARAGYTGLEDWLATSPTYQGHLTF